jgi:hypothetical protein
MNSSFRKAFLGGFVALGYLYAAIGECTHVNNHDDSIHERDGDNMGIDGHGTKIATATLSSFLSLPYLSF